MPTALRIRDDSQGRGCRKQTREGDFETKGWKEFCRDQEVSQQLCSDTKVEMQVTWGTASNLVWLVLGNRVGTGRKGSWKGNLGQTM